MGTVYKTSRVYIYILTQCHDIRFVLKFFALKRLALGKPWALYIKHHCFVLKRLSIKPCCPPFPRGGSLFSLTFKILQKFKSLRVSHLSKKHAAKTDGDFTRTTRLLFFNWRIGEIVLGQAAVLSPISRSSPRTLPIASQPIGPFTAPRSRRSLSSNRLGESAKFEREGTLANHDFI